MKTFHQAVGAQTTGLKKHIATWAKSKGLKKAQRQQVGYKDHDVDQSPTAGPQDPACKDRAKEPCIRECDANRCSRKL